MSAEPTIRPAKPRDRDIFLEMWRDFVASAPGEPGNHQMGELNWQRIIDPAHSLQAILVVDDTDRPRGFLLYLSFPFTWSRGDACYLHDLYVGPDSRGQGLARALIEHLRQIGLAAGWFKIFWMTQPDNFAAQRLYEKVATRMDYLRYDLNLNEP